MRYGDPVYKKALKDFGESEEDLNLFVNVPGVGTKAGYGEKSGYVGEVFINANLMPLADGTNENKMIEDQMMVAQCPHTCLAEKDMGESRYKCESDTKKVTVCAWFKVLEHYKVKGLISMSP